MNPTGGPHSPVNADSDASLETPVSPRQNTNMLPPDISLPSSDVDLAFRLSQDYDTMIHYRRSNYALTINSQMTHFRETKAVSVPLCEPQADRD